MQNISPYVLLNIDDEVIAKTKIKKKVRKEEKRGKERRKKNITVLLMIIKTRRMPKILAQCLVVWRFLVVTSSNRGS